VNFRRELAEAVMAGEKTVTRRVMSANARSPWCALKCAYRVGQRVAICPGRGKANIGYATVTSVDRSRLGLVDDREARREGFTDRRAFREAWLAINGTWEPESIVWRIGLRASP